MKGKLIVMVLALAGLSIATGTTERAEAAFTFGGGCVIPPKAAHVGNSSDSFVRSCTFTAGVPAKTAFVAGTAFAGDQRTVFNIPFLFPDYGGVGVVLYRVFPGNIIPLAGCYDYAGVGAYECSKFAQFRSPIPVGAKLLCTVNGVSDGNYVNTSGVCAI
jgi:hypothetical protein